MRILALDVGEKNIGLAISDQLGWTAQALRSLQQESMPKTIRAIKDIVQENQVSEIVVGMPLNMNGSLGKKAKEVADFLEDLKKEVELPIKVWDERLSSVQAEKVLLKADLSRKKRKKKIDQLAAQLILQSYLDARINPPRCTKCTKKQP